MAEAYAAHWALSLANEMRWTHIQLEGDCMVVVNALTDNASECLRPFGVIIQACREFISSFEAFSCSFIRRTGNCFTHALAHFTFSDFGTFDGVSPPAGLAI